MSPVAQRRPGAGWIDPEVLSSFQETLIDLARQNSEKTARVADLDYLRGVLVDCCGIPPIAISEGTLFPRAWWIRCGNGWRLRDHVNISAPGTAGA